MRGWTLIEYRIKPTLNNALLMPLFEATWGEAGKDYEPVLARSLTYVAAYADAELIGFVNVAWDGSIHAFLLDTTVHPEYQRRGIGTELVRRAAAEAKHLGMHWLHVDYEEHLTGFYADCGFKKANAGLIRLD